MDEHLCMYCTVEAGGKWPTWAKEYARRGECSRCREARLVLADRYITWPTVQD